MVNVFNPNNNSRFILDKENRGSLSNIIRFQFTKQNIIANTIKRTFIVLKDVIKKEKQEIDAIVPNNILLNSSKNLPLPAELKANKIDTPYPVTYTQVTSKTYIR
jgi:hypothetical protein